MRRQASNGLLSGILAVVTLALPIAFMTGCKAGAERKAREAAAAADAARIAAQVSNLVQKAEGLAKEKKYDEASGSVAEALALLPGNPGAMTVGAEIAKDRASAALEPMTALDPGQGVGAAIAAARELVQKGSDLAAGGDFKGADAVFEQVRAEVSRLTALDVERQNAMIRRGEAEMARTAAVAADAAADAPEQWVDGGAMAEKAQASFDNGQFAEADECWSRASSAFADAKAWAKGTQAVRTAKAEYEKKLLKAEPVKLDQFGGDPWAATQRFGSEAQTHAVAGEWNESVSKWLQAADMLGRAMQFAEAEYQADSLKRAKKVALEKYDAVLRVATELHERASAAEQLPECLKFVKSALSEIDKFAGGGDFALLEPENHKAIMDLRAGIERTRLSHLFPDLEPAAPAPVDVAALGIGSAQAAEYQKKVSAELRLPVAMVSRKAGIRYMLIPPGTFMMGKSAREKGEDDELSHKVTISHPFYLSAAEVTREQWMAAGMSDVSHFRAAANLPVDSVDWNRAQEYCRRLASMEGVAGGYYRLPSEAEWEYACRAGTATRFYTGESDRHIDHAIVYFETSPRKTCPVASKSPNAWGLYDMLGNVWEWCADAPRVFSEDAVADPFGQTEDELKVTRGGGWSDDYERCRSANRGSAKAGEASYDLGFRVARQLPESIE